LKGKKLAGTNDPIITKDLRSKKKEGEDRGDFLGQKEKLHGGVTKMQLSSWFERRKSMHGRNQKKPGQVPSQVRRKTIRGGETSLQTGGVASWKAVRKGVGGPEKKKSSKKKGGRHSEKMSRGGVDGVGSGSTG